jgi:hypothetical protein
MKQKAVFLITCLFIAGLPLFSQSLANKVAQAMKKVRHGKYFSGAEEPFNSAIKTKPGDLIEALKPYVTDSSDKVRIQAADIIFLASRRNKDNKLRQTAVQYLVLTCADKNSGNAGRVNKELPKYRKEDFNSIAKDSIESYIKRHIYYLDKVVMLAGYLNLTSAIPDIKAVIGNPKNDDKIKWSAHLALSRMGDDSETGYCIRVAQSKTMNDAIVYNMLPGLIYTRQKVAIDYMVTLLNSDEKDCISSNPDNNTEIVCGYRIMEFLAPIIKDFPLQTIEGVNQIRTDNYKAALETARKWFKDKAGNYEIKTDTY